MNSMFYKISELLGFFKKIPMAKKLEKLESQLFQAQADRDLVKLSKAYYNIGITYMKNGDYDRAMVYLSRSDTIFSSDDNVYKAVGENIIEDCSERIRKLESSPILTNQIREYIDKLSENLDDNQIRLWGLMTIARLVKVFDRLSVLPGCDVLGKLDKVVDLILKSAIQEDITETEVDFIFNICNQLYELQDSKDFSNIFRQVEIPENPPIQIFDLNGFLVLTELNIYLDIFLSETEEEGMSEADIVPCALLPDYYLLTDNGVLSQNPKIQKEIERILSDYEFVRSNIDWKDISERVSKYKDLDILISLE